MWLRHFARGPVLLGTHFPNFEAAHLGHQLAPSRFFGPLGLLLPHKQGLHALLQAYVVGMLLHGQAVQAQHCCGHHARIPAALFASQSTALAVAEATRR